MSNKDKNFDRIVSDRIKRDIYIIKRDIYVSGAFDLTVFDNDKEFGFDFRFMSDLFDSDEKKYNSVIKDRTKHGLELAKDTFLYFKSPGSKTIIKREFSKDKVFNTYKWGKFLSALYVIGEEFIDFKIDEEEKPKRSPARFVSYIQVLDRVWNDERLAWLFEKNI